MAIKKYFAVVDNFGTTRWYKDAKCKVLHRENDPAVQYADDGTKCWFQNGQRHRTDGPALVYADGTKEWFINGVEMTEAEFIAATQPVVEMTVADVEKLLGKRVKIVK